MILDKLFVFERIILDKISKLRHNMIKNDISRYADLRKRRLMSMFCFHCGKEFSGYWDLMVHLIHNPECENHCVDYKNDKGTVLFFEMPKRPTRIPYDREDIIENM